MTYRWNGLYGVKGSRDSPSRMNGNKGVMRAYRAEKRREAEERNARTPDFRRRSFARKSGHSRISDIEPEGNE